MIGQEHSLEESAIESNSDCPPSISKEISDGWSEMSKSHEDNKLNSDAEISDSAKSPDSFNSKIFLNWENDSNVCWLDASMAILVHNQTMRRFINKNPESQVCKMINIYDNAMNILNDFNEIIDERMIITREKLHKIQESSLKYLQPIIKYRKGEPDSAFCALYNLITEGKNIREYFDVTYSWLRQCENCETKRILNIKKPIITMAKVNKFEPNNPISLCQCPLCKKLDQKMKLVYKTLPECLIFHFENGGGDGDTLPLNFIVESRKYELTGVMTLEKSHDSTVNHFVSWIRDSSDNTWLECNDLNMEIVFFSSDLPEINLKDVYIYVYEAFDNLGTLEITDDLANSSIFSEGIRDFSINIPCIDISDESDDLKNISSDKSILENKHCSESEENIENIKAFLSCTKKEFDAKSTVTEAAMYEQNHVSDLSADILKNNSCEKDMIELKDGANVLNLETRSSTVSDVLKTDKSIKISENERYPKEIMLKSEKKDVSESKEVKLSNMSEKVACTENVKITNKMPSANTVVDVDKWIKEKVNRTKLRKNRFNEECSRFNKDRGEEIECKNSDQTDDLNPKRNIDKELQSLQSETNGIVECVQDKECDINDEIFLKPDVPRTQKKYIIDDNEESSGTSPVESILKPNDLSHLLVETFVDSKTTNACEKENVKRPSTDRKEFLVSNKSLEDKLIEQKQLSKAPGKGAVAKKNNPAMKDKPSNSKEVRSYGVNDVEHQKCDKNIIAKENFTVVEKAIPDKMNKKQKIENIGSDLHLVRKSAKQTYQKDKHLTIKEKAVKMAHNLGALSFKQRKYFEKESSTSETKDIEIRPEQNELLMKPQESSAPSVVLEIKGNPSVNLLKLHKRATQVEKLSKRRKASDDKLLRVEESKHQSEDDSEESNSTFANKVNYSKLNENATQVEVPSKIHKASDDKLLRMKRARDQMKECKSDESNDSVTSKVLNHSDEADQVKKPYKKHKISDDKLLLRMKKASFKKGIKRHASEITDSSKNRNVVRNGPSTSYADTISESIEQHENYWEDFPNSYTSRFNLSGKVLKNDSVESKDVTRDELSDVTGDSSEDDSPIKMRENKETLNMSDSDKKVLDCQWCSKENCTCADAEENVELVVDAVVDYFCSQIFQFVIDEC